MFFILSYAYFITVYFLRWNNFNIKINYVSVVKLIISIFRDNSLGDFENVLIYRYTHEGLKITRHVNEERNRHGCSIFMEMGIFAIKFRGACGVDYPTQSNKILF